ncbi:MAG: response regulator transcription factor [Elusimicrobiales bacterium]|nr:response regulator transcription factor [Elusimicrobiales bacterium]
MNNPLAVHTACEPEKASVLLGFLARAGFRVETKPREKLFSPRKGVAADVLLAGPFSDHSSALELARAARRAGLSKNAALVALLDVPKPGEDAGERASLRVSYLEAGFDECLSLEQDLRECLARIRAVLRRTSAMPCEEVIKEGPLELNVSAYALKIRGRPVPLTAKEFDLLFVFLSSPERVLSRPYLIERVWGYDYFGSPRTVDVHVRRLRSKLGPSGDMIATVACVGYKWSPRPLRRESDSRRTAGQTGKAGD